MDISKMLAELKEERVQIEEAILTLERLAQGRGKRRGRPPLWLVEARKRDSAAGDAGATPTGAAPAKPGLRAKTAAGSAKE
ncbi:MAG: hypothetical protein IT162_01820 [Bryobacterales bacterium]|nr:hypothetical protein [Bryobacterales bacterium]